MTPALKNAIQTIMKEIGAYEGREMGAMRGNGDKVVEVEMEVEPASTHLAEVEAGAEGEQGCPECAAGTCENPDHMSEDEYSAVERMG